MSYSLILVNRATYQEIRDLIEATSSAAQVGSEPTERPVAPVRA